MKNKNKNHTTARTNVVCTYNVHAFVCTNHFKDDSTMEYILSPIFSACTSM